jgi:hypothetical protein
VTAQFAGLLFLDPSFIFAEDGLEWLESDRDARDGVVVSAAFVEALTSARALDLSLLALEDVSAARDRHPRIVAALSDVRAFSHREVRLEEGAQVVQAALLDSTDPSSGVGADEWAFLQSYSFMLSKVRHPLDSFREARATTVEIGRKAGGQLIRRVIPREHVPDVLTPRLMAKAAAKWVVVGGATVGGGTLGGVAGLVLGGPVGAALGGKLGGFAAGAVSNAAVLAIDP